MCPLPTLLARQHRSPSILALPVHTWDRALALALDGRLAPVGVGLRLWNGSLSPDPAARPVGTLVVADRRTLLGLVVNPDLHFGDAYVDGRLRVDGDLKTVVEALSRIGSHAPTWRDRAALVFASLNSPGAARRNAQHHYDVGNDFYRHWLDDQMVYTCAYFETADATLERAQQAKLEMVCRKVALRPGDTVIEAGCGWGALALHMARHYGARVKAFNVSREQLAFARERARREGLAGLVEFIDDDYRNAAGRCDVFVSVGMLEHVGKRHLGSLAGVLRRVLQRETGRGLLHFIGRDVPRPLNAWIRRRIFPGAYPPTLEEVSREVLAPAGMSVVDVENLRLHYAWTLAHWRRRYARASDALRRDRGDAFHRAWELYLAGSEAAFTTGWMQLFQVVFVPHGVTPPFLTRRELYRHPLVV